ncbi:MAG: helix-turn-helix transcriptional regulator, partial [Nitrospinae bacterium]|nr:helix-turn-helix transcriptional regulator [Nitrospinota bacterium]
MRQLRGDRTQETMAGLAGVSRPAWAQWEAGTKRISADKAANLAVATG